MDGNGADAPHEDTVLEERVHRLEARVDFEQERLDRAIMALGYEREVRESGHNLARVKERTLRGDIDALLADRGQIARELSAINKKLADITSTLGAVKNLDTRIASLESTLGKWPQSPDDTGSGLAGRVARISVTNEGPTQPSSRPPPPQRTPPPTSIPPALVSVWKRHRLLGVVVLTIVSLLMALAERLGVFHR